MGFSKNSKNKNWNGFKKWNIPWNKDKRLSKEHKKKISNTHKGKKKTESHKKRIAKKVSGKPWSKARRKAQEERRGSPYIRRKPLKRIIKNGNEYSSNWNEIRKEIYKRDGWFCQECDIHCHNKVKIQCHHIDYNTTNNEYSNLITLCVPCHGKTNGKRDYWIKRFKKKIKKKGGE
jgi:hypothetical protein